MTAAFAGLRVVDFTTTIAGPHCTRLLADLGATVIKIEAPDGDMMRTRPPLRDGASAMFGQLNIIKQRVNPDLIFAGTWVAASLVPTFGSGLVFSWSADLIAIIALLGSARFFLALAGLDVGTSFGGIGSSREVMIASLAEPAMMDAYAGMLTREAIMTSSESLRTVITEAIHETAGRGQAVIVSHAASIPLAGRPDVLRVLITASADTRAQRVARDGRSGTSDAARFIRDNDAGRADYFQRFYRIERELPTHYDLVINTDALTADEATDIIVAAARRRA